LGLNGVWMGIVIANVVAVSITFSWGKYTVEHVINSDSP
jgi:Na+-driven multidrug efflux pump